MEVLCGLIVMRMFGIIRIRETLKMFNFSSELDLFLAVLYLLRTIESD
jgi:hypothetical protein